MVRAQPMALSAVRGVGRCLFVRTPVWFSLPGMQLLRRNLRMRGVHVGVQCEYRRREAGACEAACG